MWFTLHRRKFENSLKAYKISLNVDKTKLVLFVSPKKKLDNNLKTKLNGIRLFETDAHKYLETQIEKA